MPDTENIRPSDARGKAQRLQVVAGRVFAMRKPPSHARFLDQTAEYLERGWIRGTSTRDLAKRIRAPREVVEAAIQERVSAKLSPRPPVIVMRRAA